VGGDWTPVRAGRECRLRFEQRENLPVCLSVQFARVADMEIRSLTITRKE
jgi:hypothetical protein